MPRDLTKKEVLEERVRIARQLLAQIEKDASEEATRERVNARKEKIKALEVEIEDVLVDHRTAPLRLEAQRRKLAVAERELAEHVARSDVERATLVAKQMLELTDEERNVLLKLLRKEVQ